MNLKLGYTDIIQTIDKSFIVPNLVVAFGTAHTKFLTRMWKIYIICVPCLYFEPQKPLSLEHQTFEAQANYMLTCFACSNALWSWYKNNFNGFTRSF